MFIIMLSRVHATPEVEAGSSVLYVYQRSDDRAHHLTCIIVILISLPSLIFIALSRVFVVTARMQY